MLIFIGGFPIYNQTGYKPGFIYIRLYIMARFFTADLHLWDEDIAKARGFKDITEYHNRLREGWLQMLKPEDTIYVLGISAKGLVIQAFHPGYTGCNTGLCKSHTG
jgi:hypothetical protein